MIKTPDVISFVESQQEPTDLYEDSYTKNGRRMFKCDLCDKELTRRENLIKHY